jgi:hypothetical protein
MGIAAAEQAAEFRLPLLRSGRQAADLLLVPARPAHLGGVGALARRRDGAAVDEEEVAVGVEAELRLDPGPHLGRHVLVPNGGRLHDVAVAIEHGEVLAGRHGRRLLAMIFFFASMLPFGRASEGAAGDFLPRDER